MTALRTSLLLLIVAHLGPGPVHADATRLSAGGYHLLGVNAGEVRGLGDGTYGQLGSSPAGAPATVAGLTGVAQVAAGGFSTIVLKWDGTVWFLGETTLQHTTPHGTPNPVAVPAQVAGLGGIEALAAGHRHYLALDADTGDLFAWGHNGSGQVGNGGLLDVSTPVLVLTGVASMTAGDGFSLAVRNDGTAWGWGRNGHGQLGLGDTADRLVPTQVPGVSTAVAAAAGGRHSLILLGNGALLATGNNAFGQLGTGTTASTSTPAAVAGPGGITAIAAGYHHSAALDASGQVFLWGRNFEGQCGGGAASPVSYASPQTVTTLPADPVTLACGYHFTVFAFIDGTVWGTGSNSDGQLDGSSVADQDDSQRVVAPQAAPLTIDPAGPDENPPVPNPMSFADPPAALNESTITMTATTATDISGPVEYYFENTANGNFRDWGPGTTWTNTGLTPGQSYGFRVRARDAELNVTDWSAVANAVAEADTTPPAPSAMSFAVPPTALGTSSITMTATTASDVNGVEYFFDCTTPGGHDSAWQDDPTYVDTGLLPDTAYSYRVQARDKSAARNVTAFS
ncbi:MAG: hypothetical protein HKO57_05360, partial [Akkermansiaceae bacterium]|nr:hypothetical protein [Akkermansiaceae bacterium]